ncbi:MAG: T9SS type A sorting domain-containing protein, partial [Cytophagales bacterium]|nr:T9SS type A sorting domain-containing protein [Cytophagales bacterium]
TVFVSEAGGRKDIAVGGLMPNRPYSILVKLWPAGAEGTPQDPSGSRIYFAPGDAEYPNFRTQRAPEPPDEGEEPTPPTAIVKINYIEDNHYSHKRVRVGVSANRVGVLYAKAVQASATASTAADIVAADHKITVSAAQYGLDRQIVIEGLSPEAEYKVYAVLKLADGNYSQPVAISNKFTTIARPVVAKPRLKSGISVSDKATFIFRSSQKGTLIFFPGPESAALNAGQIVGKTDKTTISLGTNQVNQDVEAVVGVTSVDRFLFGESARGSLNPNTAYKVYATLLLPDGSYTDAISSDSFTTDGSPTPVLSDLLINGFKIEKTLVHALALTNRRGKLWYVLLPPDVAAPDVESLKNHDQKRELPIGLGYLAFAIPSLNPGRTYRLHALLQAVDAVSDAEDGVFANSVVSSDPFSTLPSTPISLRLPRIKSGSIGKNGATGILGSYQLGKVFYLALPRDVSIPSPGDLGNHSQREEIDISEEQIGEDIQVDLTNLKEGVSYRLHAALQTEDGFYPTVLSSEVFTTISTPDVGGDKREEGTEKAPTVAETLLGLHLAPDVRIYPNPFSDAVNLEGLARTSLDKLSLCDLLGRQIPLNKVKGTRLELSHLPPGIYFLNVLHHGEFRCLRLIKE